MIVREIWEDNEIERPKEKLLLDTDVTETIALGYVSVKSGGQRRRQLWQSALKCSQEM